MPSYACCGVRKYGLSSFSTSAEGGPTIYSRLRWFEHIPEKKAGLESRGLSSSLLSRMSCGNSTEASWQTNIIVWKSITIWHVLWSRTKVSWPTRVFYPLQKALTGDDYRSHFKELPLPLPVQSIIRPPKRKCAEINVIAVVIKPTTVRYLLGLRQPPTNIPGRKKSEHTFTGNTLHPHTGVLLPRIIHIISFKGWVTHTASLHSWTLFNDVVLH